jgi:DNA modification methylase
MISPNGGDMKIGKVDLGLIKSENKIFGDVCSINDDNFATIPDGSIDLVLTDPPFNIARDTNFHTYEKNTINSFRFDADKGWDSYSPEGFRSLLSQWSIEFERVLRPGGSFAVFCADEYLSDLIMALRKAGLKPRRTMTWRKPNAVPVNRKHMMMSACEYIVLGVKGSKSVFNSDVDVTKEDGLTIQEIIAISDKVAVVAENEISKMLEKMDTRVSTAQLEELITEKIRESSTAIAKRALNIYSEDSQSAQLCVPNFVSFNSKGGNRLHPTEKPVKLLKYLISLLSNEGETIMDPFSGSASTGQAAFEMKRSAFLIERDSEFFKKGCDRLEEIMFDSEGSLFPKN